MSAPAFAVDWPMAAVSAVAGVAGSVLMASLTLRRALRTPVREALNSEGLVSGFGASAARPRHRAYRGAATAGAHWGTQHRPPKGAQPHDHRAGGPRRRHSPWAWPPLGQAVSQVTNQSWDVLDYDITLSAQTGGHDYGPAIVDAVRSQPGIAGVEAIDESEMSYRGQTLYALGVNANSFIHETLTAGRWLRAQDERADAPVMVAGSAFARLEHLHPGSRVVAHCRGRACGLHGHRHRR